MVLPAELRPPVPPDPRFPLWPHPAGGRQQGALLGLSLSPSALSLAFSLPVWFSGFGIKQNHPCREWRLPGAQRLKQEPIGLL